MQDLEGKLSIFESFVVQFCQGWRDQDGPQVRASSHAVDQKSARSQRDLSKDYCEIFCVANSIHNFIREPLYSCHLQNEESCEYERIL